MTDSTGLSRILQDLAAGRIDAVEADRLIKALQSSAAPSVFDTEALYDSPPARAMTEDADEPQPATGDGVEPKVVENVEAWVEPVVELEPIVDATPVDAGPPRPSDRDDVVFSVQLDDLAATAGDMLRDAGGLARSAFQRLGELAGGVVSEGVRVASQPAPPAHGSGESAAGGTRGIERVVLRSVGRRVRLIGDPSVAAIAVDGPHTLRRQGMSLELTTEGELGVNLDALSIVHPPRTLEDLRILGFGRELVVRVNPAILVDAEVTGSRLTTLNVPHLGTIRVSAGSANLTGVVQVRDALIQAGGASLAGPISEGRSRVRVESGNLSVNLTSGANVTIRSHTQLGRVSWPGEPHGDLDEFVVGNGSAQLEISVVMGRAAVRVAPKPGVED